MQSKHFVFVSLNRELFTTVRRFLTLWSLVAILCLAILPSCSQDDKDVEKPAEVNTALTLSTNTIDAAVEGGTYSIDYTLTGGYEGIGVKTSCDATWITDVVVTDTTISFTALANSGLTPREAIITVRYPGVDNQLLTITQSCDTSLFDMVISKETSTSCVSTVTCDDPNMAYIVSLADISYFRNAGISTAEELFMNEYNYHKGLAAEYNENLGQFMFINEIAFYDKSTIQWTTMTPNVDYVLYVYGIEFNDSMTEYTLATPVSHIMVRLKGQELRDVEFDVTVTVNGPEAHYEFEPINWSGGYYIDIYTERDYRYLPEGETPSEEYCQGVVDNWLQLINQYMASGYSGTPLYNIMCLKGKDSYSETLDADTGYMMSFYAIELTDGIPQVASRPYLVHFRTEPVAQSDMTFEVAVTDVYTRVADVRVTPSNVNDPYTVALVPTQDIPDDHNEQEIINWYVTSYRASSFKGEIFSHLNTLSPETSYTLLVFGYYGGVITTDLTRVDFTTDPVSECENSVVRVDFMGPYSSKELAKHYPDAVNGMEDMYEQYGFYVMWAEIITEVPSQDVFIGICEPSEFDEGDDAVFEDLVSYTSPNISFLTARSGVEFVMCGATMDYRGNYSEMWTSDPFTYEYNATTKRPIEELISKLVSPSQTGRLMIVAPDAAEPTAQSLVARMK